MKKESIKICLIDDHKIVRHGLKELLEKIGGFEVIQEFDSGIDFLKALPLKPEPDLCILDYSMSGLNGVEVLQELEQQKSDYKVLLLTQHLEETIISKAYKHGARGFLNKNCSAPELKKVITSIVEYGYYNVTEILNYVRNYEPKGKVKEEIIAPLHPKELDFLRLVCNGEDLTYEEMAKIMGVSVKTIDGYRSSLFERYHIKSKVGLVLFSFKFKLTAPFV
jgi:DNA-binding NarL/FixJ family response regulator